MRNYHLVILKKVYLDLILTGEKTIESRLMKVQRAPYRQVTVGDCLFLKQSASPVVAKARVAKCQDFENLDAGKIDSLKSRYDKKILGTGEYWRSRKNCKYATLIWLEKICPIKPLLINKKDRRAWIVLTERQNYGLLNKDS